MSLDPQQVPPQAAVPVIHVKYKGRRYRAPLCENSSSVQQWVFERFGLETAELQYADDGTWVVFDSDVDKDGGLQARTNWLLQVLEKEPAEKKMRVEGGCEGHDTFQVLIHADEGRKFVEALTDRFLAEKKHKDAEYCHPTQLSQTWNLNAWGAQLVEAYNRVVQNKQSRGARVMSLSCGSGYGKTHGLLVAAKAWATQLVDSAAAAAAAAADQPPTKPEPLLVYITFNLEQLLVFDKRAETASLCILLRLLLVSSGYSNKACATVLRLLQLDKLVGDEETLLLELTRQHLEQKASAHGGRMVLAVDECCLIAPALARVVSTLGELASQLWKDVDCLVLVSTLTDESFQTLSQRPVMPVQLPCPASHELHDFLAAQEHFAGIDARQWLTVLLMAGGHWRSAVVGAQKILDNRDTAAKGNFPTLLSYQLGFQLAQKELALLENYILSEYKYGQVKARYQHSKVEIFLGPDGSVPPPLLWRAFCFNDASHPLRDFFSNSTFASSTKQLEICGLSWDRFKAAHKLPLLPRCTTDVKLLQLPDTHRRSSDWYFELVFDPLVETSTESLFKQSSAGVSRTDTPPQLRKFFHSQNSSRFWVDRVAVARHQQSQDALCLVLYQDKISACRKEVREGLYTLQKAAESFGSEFPDILCVIQAPGYDGGHDVFKGFCYPLLTVTAQSLTTFYRSSFVQAVLFQLRRHSC